MNTLTLVVGSLVLLLLVIRQFTEQAVNWRTLLLLPVLSACASYIDLQWAFAHFSLLLLTLGLASGVLAGLASGIFRGRHTRVRLDPASGMIRSRPEPASSFMWLGLLIVRMGTLILTYAHLQQSNALIGFLTAFGGTVFLVSIATQKYLVYTQYSRLIQNSGNQFNMYPNEMSRE